MVKNLALISVLVILASASWTDQFFSRSFETYKQDYGKSYSPFENEFRMLVFKENVLKHISHNTNPANTWRMGANKFTDWTDEEFHRFYLMQDQNCSATYGSMQYRDPTLPTSYDWRDEGIVSPVKNQGKCGSCWTFSTTGAMESHWAIYKSVAPPLLSEQQLVDCAGAFDNHGCHGGLPSHAFEYINYVGGLTSEDQYAYTALDGTCQSDWKPVAYTKGSFNITAYDEDQLQQQLVEAGPISIAFQVVSDFRHYESGVYSSADCKNGPQDVNHAVLTVGYGVDAGQEYWIVKNSWGADWGNQGYFWIAKGENMCGLAVCASYPLMGDEQSRLSQSLW